MQCGFGYNGEDLVAAEEIIRVGFEGAAGGQGVVGAGWAPRGRGGGATWQRSLFGAAVEGRCGGGRGRRAVGWRGGRLVWSWAEDERERVERQGAGGRGQRLGQEGQRHVCGFGGGSVGKDVRD